MVYFDKSGIRNLAIEIGRVHPHEIASNKARLAMKKRLLIPFILVWPVAICLFMVNLVVSRSSIPVAEAYHGCQDQVGRDLV